MSRRRWPTPGGWCTSCAHQPWTNSAWSPPCASRQPAWGWTARASRCRWRRRTGWTGCPPRWRWPPTGSRLRRWPMPVGTPRPVAARCAWPWRTGCASRYATTAGACPPIRLTGSGWRRCGSARASWAAGARSRRPPTGGPASAPGFRWLLMTGERLRVLQADALVRQLRPDLVVMDLHMPELDGIEATRRILDHDPTVAVLVLTMLEDDDSVFAALQAGARGYLLKGADHDDITRAVQAVAQGEAIFGPAVASRVLAYFAFARSPIPSPVLAELTDREREVLELLAAGHPNAAIAQQLFLSPKTVRNYISSIFAKLQVASRGEAIVRAREQGLGGATH